MKNGLYSFHMHMLDGVGRDSGILVLRDGNFLGGGPCFWSIGSYTFGNGTWKGELRKTSTHRCPIPSSARSPVVKKSPAGFPGPLQAPRPRLSFHATLKRLADN